MGDPKRPAGPIIAMGGTEFTVGRQNELLHDYVVAAANERSGPRRARVCLLPTAGGDPHHQISAFSSAMERRGCEASAVSLFRLGESRLELEPHLLAQDLIYVTGGNMVNLMALWKEHGVDEILRRAHRDGIVLCGYSAGSMCWFERGLSTGVGSPVPTRGLGLLPGSHCVHYHQDPDRRATYRLLVGTGELPAGLALDDHTAALFRNGELLEAVRSVESAGAFRVEPAEGGLASDSALPIRTLESTVGSSGDPAIEELRGLRRRRSPAGPGG